MVEVSGYGPTIAITCQSAIEFVQVLSPVGGCFQQSPSAGFFIFRGSGSSDYDLRPSSFRHGRRLWHRGSVITTPLTDAVDQCAAEFETIRRFFEIAAREGLRLPEDSHDLREIMSTWRARFARMATGQFETFTWPPPQFYSLIGLCQHYGIPTRALDWSWSSFVAAYFAARFAADAARSICVWVYNHAAHELNFLSGADAEPANELVLFSASGADNENLRAQRALFMLHTDVVERRDERFGAPSYESLMTQGLTKRWSAIIFKVSVAKTEARRILALLAGAGVTGASVFPGFWGVMRELEETELTIAETSALPQNDIAGRVSDQIAALLQDGA